MPRGALVNLLPNPILQKKIPVVNARFHLLRQMHLPCVCGCLQVTQNGISALPDYQVGTLFVRCLAVRDLNTNRYKLLHSARHLVQ